MSVQDVVFWILAVAVIVPALGVVLVKDLFHSVLLLVDRKSTLRTPVTEKSRMPSSA